MIRKSTKHGFESFFLHFFKTVANTCDLVYTRLALGIEDLGCVWPTIKPLEIGGSGGAAYLPYMVLHHCASVNTEGNVNSLGTRSLVYHMLSSSCHGHFINEGLSFRIRAKTPDMRKRPNRKRPIFLTFHNSVFLLLFFLLSLLFLSRSLFLSYFFFAGLYSHENTPESCIWPPWIHFTRVSAHATLYVTLKHWNKVRK